MSGQKVKAVWFFRLEGGGNFCMSYVTEDKDKAVQTLEREYGYKAVDAVMIDLTAEEYAGLLRCNYRGYGERVYPAIQDLFFRSEKLEEALTPSAETKAAYIGEFFEQIEMPNPDYCGCGDCDACEMFPDTPETYTVDVPVSWDTIKKIMAMIRERAGV